MGSGRNSTKKSIFFSNFASNFFSGKFRYFARRNASKFGKGLTGRQLVGLCLEGAMYSTPSQSETLTIPNLLRAKIEGLDHCPPTCTHGIGGDLFKLAKEIYCFTRETYGPTTINREA